MVHCTDQSESSLSPISSLLELDDDDDELVLELDDSEDSSGTLRFLGTWAILIWLIRHTSQHCWEQNLHLIEHSLHTVDKRKRHTHAYSPVGLCRRPMAPLAHINILAMFTTRSGIMADLAYSQHVLT
eukprot:12416137-Karenia_brevis.AAC.1